MEWHKVQGYEYSSRVYIIPDLTIEQSFLLLRLVGEFPDLINEKDPFPSKNLTIKNDIGDKAIEVEREKTDDKAGPVKKIKMTSAQAPIPNSRYFSWIPKPLFSGVRGFKTYILTADAGLLVKTLRPCVSAVDCINFDL